MIRAKDGSGRNKRQTNSLSGCVCLLIAYCYAAAAVGRQQKQAYVCGTFHRQWYKRGGRLALEVLNARLLLVLERKEEEERGIIIN